MHVAAIVPDELGAALQRARIAARLADAQSPAEVGRVVVEDLRAAAGADSAVLALPTDDGRHLVLATSHLPEDVTRELSTIPLDSDLPVAGVFRTGAAAFAGTRGEVDALVPGGTPRAGVGAFAAIPVLGADGVVAAYALGFDAPRVLEPRERDTLLDVARMVAAALERARLREAERAAHVRLAVLAEASTRFLATSPDLGALLEIAAELLSLATGDLAVVRLLAPDGSRFQETAFRHPDPALREEFGAAIAADLGVPVEGRRAAVLASGRTLFVPVVEPTFAGTTAEAFRPYLEAHRIHSLVLAPLVVDGRTIGTASVLRHRPHAPYGAHDRRVVEGLSDRAALAVAHARLHAAHRQAREAAERAAERTARLQAVTSRLAAATTVDEVCEAAARLGLDAAGAVAGGIALVDRETGAIRLALHPESAPDDARRRASVRVDDTPVAAVVRTGCAGWYRDAAEVAAAHPRRRGALAPGDEGGLAVLPLCARAAVLGALTLRFAGPRTFDADDRAFLGNLAEQCAQALERARLREEDARRHLELAAERARLAEVLARAEVASQAKDEFIAMLSHELRNPLAPIVTALHLMKLRGAEGGRERDVIERQVTHLLRLVDDLLDVSRVTRGTVRLDRRPVEASEIVARGVELASPLLEERRHTLTVEVADGLRLDADPARMAQVLSNLLTNAAKYTDPGGRIAVRASAEHAAVRFCVTDSGIGISPALLPRIFDLFVQGDRSIDRAPGGLGIGLTIVRSLVDLHGGRVTAESGGAGRGSTFTVWVPLAAREAALAAPRRPLPPAAPTPLRVLVVDDNEDAAELLADALRARGHEVRTAYDGPSALALAERFRPEVALLDLGLPVMDGYELARRLREVPGAGELALAAVTGYGQDLDRRQSAAAGFREHLVKPVELERVCDVVERLARTGAP